MTHVSIDHLSVKLLFGVINKIRDGVGRPPYKNSNELSLNFWNN